MYISHKYKFIFLRTPKTASSSLSEFLIRNVDDPDAIYTEVDDTDIPGTLDENIVNKYRKDFKHFHFTLEDLVNEKVITPDHIRKYYCFAVLRDPIERQKSFYYFYKKWRPEHKNRPVSLQEYKSMAPHGFFKGEPNSKILQSSFLNFNGKQYGEYWLYENLDKHIETFIKEKGIWVRHNLPQHKSSFRNGHDDLRFDHESISRLRNVFQEDLNLYSTIKKEYYEANKSIHP